MHTLKGKAGVALTTLVLTTGLFNPPSSAHSASAPPTARAAGPATPYLIGASGFASRVIGGDLPAGSDRSAFAVIGCTNKAGRQATNSKADVQVLPGLRLDNVSTRAWSTKRGKTVSAHGRHTIERVVLADTVVGRLSLRGLESRSRAWHDAGGFHSTTSTKLAGIAFDPVVGPRVQLPVPLPGETLNVPGLAKISLGEGTTSRSGHRAYADADAIKLELTASGTKVFLAHSRATLSDGVKTALFRGAAYAADADVLDGVVTSGREPNVLTPCQGTDGKVRSKAVAQTDILAGVIGTGAKASTRSGYDGKGRAYVDNRASLTRVALAGDLAVRGIVARARVAERGNGFRVNTNGTRVGRIMFEGEQVDLPTSGDLQIPGVANIETNVVERKRNSVRVTAVRITLLDGQGAVINLGNARATLVRSGL